MQVAASNMLATRRKLPGRFWAVRESNLYNQMSGISSGAPVEVWGVWYLLTWSTNQLCWTCEVGPMGASSSTPGTNTCKPKRQSAARGTWERPNASSPTL